MALPPRDLAKTLRESLLRRPAVLEAYLFGSVARGEAQPHSDVDVAVYLDPAGRTPASIGDAAEIATDLMAALGTNEVDVVVLNDASPLLYHRVLRDGVRFLSRDLPATTTREGRALSRYFDFLPQLDKIDAILSRRWKRGEAGT